MNRNRCRVLLNRIFRVHEKVFLVGENILDSVGNFKYLGIVTDKSDNKCPYENYEDNLDGSWGEREWI